MQRVFLMATLICLISVTAHADILVRSNGELVDGKLISDNSSGLVFQPDGTDASAALKLARPDVARVVKTDEHGMLLSDGSAPATRPAVTWNVPTEPTAPPIAVPPAGPSCCVIPLHGEVGGTILASILEKSLADALLRKPTVVVLDIDSPGGMVDEARQIIDVLHRYNKKLRIVALAGEDLSAAAIFTLSVREIYLKPSGTIGAATSFVPGKPDLSAKVEEKMQSAWCAEARSSAEEGRHEPLLAEAMIDNDMELHLETVDGKPVVKDGPGERMLCRKGKILTLTSHEAVSCGLAAGDADDLNELATALHLDHWTEVKGLGTMLAEAMPARMKAYQSQGEKIAAKFQQDLKSAIDADPSQVITTVTRSSPVTMPQPYMPGQYPGHVFRECRGLTSRRMFLSRNSRQRP